MNAFPPHDGPAADEQAALWAARLEGSTLTEAGRTALEAWLAENPAHRALLSQYCQFSAELETRLPALVAAGAVAMPAAAASDRPRPGRARRRWIAFGLLAAAAAVALAVWVARPETSVENLATPVAQRQSVTLADGTRVELNARTSLRVENGPDERRVRLAEGEAYFRVHQDRNRPFIVETPAGSVRVTGTVFDVRTTAAGDFDVTVVEGSVRVRPGDTSGVRPPAPVMLGAGDQLTADPRGVEVRKLSAGGLDDALAWRQGQIVFDGVPLRAALARFAHYHGRGITATDGAADLRVSGRFSLDDLDGFFAALEAVLPVKVTRDLSGTVRVSLRSER